MLYFLSAYVLFNVNVINIDECVFKHKQQSKSLKLVFNVGSFNVALLNV